MSRVVSRTLCAAVVGAWTVVGVTTLAEVRAELSPDRAQTDETADLVQAVAAGGIVVNGAVVETKADPPCWPAASDANSLDRYIDCGNGTVLDTKESLLWLQDANCLAGLTRTLPGERNWWDATAFAADLTHGQCGLTDHSQPGDWRLPTAGEWESAIDYAVSFYRCTKAGTGDPPSLTADSGTACLAGGASSFLGVESDAYWSSATDSAAPSGARAVNLELGTTMTAAKAGSALAWPVRDARRSATGTGAGIIVDGAAAETQADPPCWPAASDGNASHRYIDCGNGTVLDTVTGLLWLQDANCLALGPPFDLPGDRSWWEAQAIAAGLAHGQCGLTDHSQPGDWRLASPSEWETMIERAVGLPCLDPALTNDQGDACFSVGPSSFVNVEADSYWSLTSAIVPSTAEAVSLKDGSLRTAHKAALAFLWPVRGGG